MKKLLIILIFVLVLLFSLAIFTAARPNINASDAETLKKRHEKDANDASIYYSIPAKRILAIIAKESKGNQSAVGSAGEVGVMQLTKGAIDDVNKQFGAGYSVDNVKSDSRKNIYAGTGYLRILIDEFKLDLKKATRAYNAGASRVKWNPFAGYEYLLGVEANEKLFS